MFSSLIIYDSTIFRFWYVCSRLFPFSFSLAFCFTKIVRETICKFLYIYAKWKCIFMQGIMINRKLFGNFGFSSIFAKTSYLITLWFSVRFMFWKISGKRKQKRKSRIFAVFAVIPPFLSQIKRCFSVIYGYIGQITPHPSPFWHSQGWSALVRNFLFFYFYFL